MLARILSMFWNDLKAAWRGQRRVAPRFGATWEPTRGRIYSTPSIPTDTRARPIARLHARHIKANGEVTDYFVDAEVK